MATAPDVFSLCVRGRLVGVYQTEDAACAEAVRRHCSGLDWYMDGIDGLAALKGTYSVTRWRPQGGK